VNGSAVCVRADVCVRTCMYVCVCLCMCVCVNMSIGGVHRLLPSAVAVRSAGCAAPRSAGASDFALPS